MKDPKRFYTYAYLHEDRTPYYVGKGEGRRAYSKRHRVSVPPTDRILFLKTNLLEEDALKHEEYMIKVFGRKDNGTGILANLTDGGIATSGYIRTEEQKEYLRNLWLGEKSPMYGSPKSPETRRKMSEAQLGEKNHRYGKRYTEEEKKKRSEKMKGRPAPWNRRKHTEEEKQKRRQKMLGRKWWNNGIEEGLSHKQPNEDWILGKLSKTLPQVWEVISPDGIVYIINNLSLFCREKFNKTTSVLANVAYGINKSYKGYKCRKLTKYEYA
jgi:hypothetical protein